MEQLRAYIIEDEKHNREYLMSLLETHFGDKIRVCGSSDSVLESLEYLKSATVDILFLDIELSDGQVFDVLKQIPYKNYRLIFVTGYSEHAIRAIRFSAVDYLLKPIVTAEFIEAVNKAISHEAEENPVLNDMIDMRKFDISNYLIINNRQSIEKITMDTITHLEADGVYTIIHHEGKKTISSKPLGVYEDVLSPKLFCRCHKSFIVNKFFIKRVEKGRGLEITLYDGKLIPVAVRKKEEFGVWFKG